VNAERKQNFKSRAKKRALDKDPHLRSSPSKGEGKSSEPGYCMWAPAAPEIVEMLGALAGAGTWAFSAGSSLETHL